MTSHRDQSPDGSSGSLRTRMAVGAAVLAVLVGTGVGIALISDGTDPDTQTSPTVTPDSGPTATVIHEDDFDRDRSEEPDPEPASIEDFEWMSAALPVPDGVWVGVIGLIDTSDRLLAFGRATDPGASTPEEAHSLLVWESDSGTEWKAAGDVVGIPDSAEVEEVVFHDGVFTAVGMMANPDHPRRRIPVVSTSHDGLTWTAAELPTNGLENGELWLERTASGNGGTVVMLTFSSGHSEPELIIEKEGKTLVANADDWTLTITSEAGEVLFSGTPEQIWQEGGEPEFGLVIRDPETRDQLFTVSWERLEMDPDEVTEDGARVYLVDEYRLTVDEFADSYSVEDTSTGTTILTGTIEELFRGPPPIFTDADGEVLISLTWEEVGRAMELAWMEMEEGEEDYFSRPVVFHSSDGRSFEEITFGGLTNATEVHIGDLVATENGFIAFGDSWSGAGEPRQLVWKSTDGVTWETYQPTGDNLWLRSVTSFDNKYLALGEGHETDSSLMTSSDGLGWETVMISERQDDGHTWFTDLAVGPLGIVVSGETEGAFEGRGTYEIESDGILLVVEPGFLYLVDTESQQVLMEGDLDSLRAQSLVEVSDDTITFMDETGEILVETSWPEIQETLEQSTGDEEEFGHHEVRSELWFSTDGEHFSMLGVSELDGIYITEILVGSDVIALAGDQMTVIGSDEMADVATTEAPADIAGHYHVDDGPEAIPTPVVVVGVPSEG